MIKMHLQNKSTHFIEMLKFETNFGLQLHV